MFSKYWRTTKSFSVFSPDATRVQESSSITNRRRKGNSGITSSGVLRQISYRHTHTICHSHTHLKLFQDNCCLTPLLNVFYVEMFKFTGLLLHLKRNSNFPLLGKTEEVPWNGVGNHYVPVRTHISDSILWLVDEHCIDKEKALFVSASNVFGHFSKHATGALNELWMLCFAGSLALRSEIKFCSRSKRCGLFHFLHEIFATNSDRKHIRRQTDICSYIWQYAIFNVVSRYRKWLKIQLELAVSIGNRRVIQHPIASRYWCFWLPYALADQGKKSKNTWHTTKWYDVVHKQWFHHDRIHDDVEIAFWAWGVEMRKE